MFRPKSLQHEYDEHSPYDPAFVQAPETPATFKDDAEKKAHEAELEEHERKVELCRSTNDWSSLLVAGAGEPTKFRLRPIPGDVFRKFMDLCNGGLVGPAQAGTLLLQLALVGVANLDGFKAGKVGRINHPELGSMANAEVPNLLDRCDKRIVAELALVIKERALGVRPLS